METQALVRNKRTKQWNLQWNGALLAPSFDFTRIILLSLSEGVWQGVSAGTLGMCIDQTKTFIDNSLHKHVWDEAIAANAVVLLKVKLLDMGEHLRAKHKIKPVILLHKGNPLVMYASKNGLFKDPGATCITEYNKIQIHADNYREVDLSSVGEIQIKYNCTDHVGLHASPITREVLVTRAPPVIRPSKLLKFHVSRHIHGIYKPREGLFANKTINSILQSVRCKDQLDGDISLHVKMVSSYQVALHSIQHIGMHSLEFNCTNGAGLTTTHKVILHVLRGGVPGKTYAPAIRLIGPKSVKVRLHGPFRDPGGVDW